MLHWRFLNCEGYRYVDVSVGELRDEDGSTPDVLQAQILHGFSHGITLYGGMQAAENYGSAALGVGKDLGALGAISFDVTHARATLATTTATGQSYRFLIQNDLTTQTLACAWLAIVTPPRATIPSMSGHRGATALKTFGKQVTDVVAWRETLRSRLGEIMAIYT